MTGSPHAMVVVVALLLASAPAIAFKPARHKEYTQRAGSWLKGCGFGPQVAEDFKHLAQGTENEDKPTLLRARNWHYAHNPKMSRGFVFMRTDLEGIFPRRVDEVVAYAQSDTCKRAVLFEKAGRVLHYIQDMRVPAHVIPINHGFVFGDDQFDGYPFIYEEINGPTHAECDGWKEAKRNVTSRELHRLLRQARDDTRQQIDRKLKVNGMDQACTWGQVFWCDSTREACGDELPGFGSYRADRFGASYVNCAGALVEPRMEDYLQFFKSDYRKMLKDIVSVWLFAGQLAETYCPS